MRTVEAIAPPARRERTSATNHPVTATPSREKSIDRRPAAERDRNASVGAKTATWSGVRVIEVPATGARTDTPTIANAVATASPTPTVAARTERAFGRNRHAIRERTQMTAATIAIPRNAPATRTSVENGELKRISSQSLFAYVSQYAVVAATINARNASSYRTARRVILESRTPRRRRDPTTARMSA